MGNTRKQRNDRDKLPDEWLSVRHPEFASIENAFVLRDFPWRYIEDATDYDVVELLLTRLKQENDDQAVLDAIRILGLPAIQPTQSSTLSPEDPEAIVAFEINGLVWVRVERWYRDARHARTPEERSAAASLLRRLGRTLAGSRKGLGKRVVTNPFAAWRHYRRMLFRLLMARRLLGVQSWRETRNEKIAAVCKASGFPEPDFRHYLGIDEECTRVSRRQAPSQAARIVAANNFNVTEQTIANRLTGPGSRK